MTASRKRAHEESEPLAVLDRLLDGSRIAADAVAGQHPLQLGQVHGRDGLVGAQSMYDEVILMWRGDGAGLGSEVLRIAGSGEPEEVDLGLGTQARWCCRRLAT